MQAVIDISMRILAIVFLVIVVICTWKTAEFFNTLPEGYKHKTVIAWDVLVLFFVAIALIIRIVTM